MARNTRTTVRYGRVKDSKGRVRFRRISKKKTVTKGPKKSEFLRSLEGLSSADKAKVIKAQIRGKTTQVATAAAGTTSSAITTGQSMRAGNIDYSNNTNLNQNVQGGIQKSENHRDDDDEYDFPGAN